MCVVSQRCPCFVVDDPVMKNLALLFLVVVIMSSCMQSAEAVREGQRERPDYYASTSPQFVAYNLWDSRQMAIMRHGAGVDRHAEYRVFDIVDHGRRLRQTYMTVMSNEFNPWGMYSVCQGRFLVTMDEHSIGRGVALHAPSPISVHVPCQRNPGNNTVPRSVLARP